MSICYHKEAFMAGMLITLFLFEAVMLFEDEIINRLKRIINNLKQRGF